MVSELIIDNIILPSGDAGNIRIVEGRIASIGKESMPAQPSGNRMDGEGALVLPGLIDAHIHLDKTFLGDSWKPHRPCTAGFNVHERVAFEKEALAASAPTEQRAVALLEQVIGYGTTHLRCHVDIDPEVGLRNLELVAMLRERYRNVIDIQIVAFPQSGIIRAPGTAELLDKALKSGADLIGGLDPIAFDGDMKGHLDVVFGLAERHGVGIDIHLHEPDTLGIMELEEIARRSTALGMQGHVAVSHAYSLGEVSESVALKTADALAIGGVAIMTNAPGHQPFPPVSLLRNAGVTVFAGNDNIRDAWWPYGEGDMLERAMIIGYRSGYLTDEDITHTFELITRNSAKVMTLDNYGMAVGDNADLVLIKARNIPETIVARPVERTVLKHGQVIARAGRFIGI